MRIKISFCPASAIRRWNRIPEEMKASWSSMFFSISSMQCQRLFKKGSVIRPSQEIDHPRFENLSHLPEFEETILLHLEPGTDGEIDGLDIGKKAHILDIDSIPDLDLDEAHDRKDTEGFPKGGPADVELFSQAPFRGQPILGFVIVLQNQGLDLLHRIFIQPHPLDRLEQHAFL